MSPADDLTVALVQEASSLDPAENRQRLRERVAEATAPATSAVTPDLVVLPEAFARDFGPAGSDVSAFAEPLDGPFASEVAAAAEAGPTTVVAGMFEAGPDPDRPWNTLVARGPGVAASYRKVHLYDSFGYRESDRLLAAPVPPDPVVVDVAGWSVGLMTCYDVRFPEMARLLVDAGAEVLVLPSAWVAGERKVDHWRTLLRARAVENTVWVAAAAQPGPRYSGHSLVVAPDGDVVAEAGGDSAEVVVATLEAGRLADVRRTNPSLANRRL